MTTNPPPEDWACCAETVWLPTAGEMERLDREAVDSGSVEERTLIEAAGREVARELALRYPEGPVLGLIGSGHNGADALVALRTLAARGREVRAVLCAGTAPDPEVLAGWDVPLLPGDRLEEAARGATVLLDGILGTGARGAARDPQAARIRTALGLGLPAVAVDVPSGADLHAGEVTGDALRADLTVVLGWPKLGHLAPAVRTRCGTIVVVEIGFPPPDPPPRARAITGRWVRGMLPRRSPGDHKGDAGYLTIVAGQEGMAGAAVLAARAAGRTGAGIVRVLGAAANRSVLQAAVPDALFGAWEDREAGEEAVAWADALVLGPGLGRGSGRRELVRRVLEARGERPALLDADALSVWEGEAARLGEFLREGDLLTPHPGELARLLGREPGDVLQDPAAIALETAGALGVTVLLKGAPSLVALPEGSLRVATTAGREVASGGSGDVLSGAAGALLAAGRPSADAAAAALLLTGLSARRSVAAEGHLASDVPDRLPAVRAAVAALPPHPGGPRLWVQEPDG